MSSRKTATLDNLVYTLDILAVALVSALPSPEEEMSSRPICFRMLSGGGDMTPLPVSQLEDTSWPWSDTACVYAVCAYGPSVSFRGDVDLQDVVFEIALACE